MVSVLASRTFGHHSMFDPKFEPKGWTLISPEVLIVDEFTAPSRPLTVQFTFATELETLVPDLAPQNWVKLSLVMFSNPFVRKLMGPLAERMFTAARYVVIPVVVGVPMLEWKDIPPPVVANDWIVVGLLEFWL